MKPTRGPYGGCVGYFSFNGNLDTCITIRTALRFPHVPHLVFDHPLPLPRARDSAQAGGGWVNDFDPNAELQESGNKSKAVLPSVAFPRFGSNSKLHHSHSLVKLTP